MHNEPLIGTVCWLNGTGIVNHEHRFLEESSGYAHFILWLYNVTLKCHVSLCQSLYLELVVTFLKQELTNFFFKEGGGKGREAREFHLICGNMFVIFLIFFGAP